MTEEQKETDYITIPAGDFYEMVDKIAKGEAENKLSVERTETIWPCIAIVCVVLIVFSSCSFNDTKRMELNTINKKIEADLKYKITAIQCDKEIVP